MTIRDQGAGYSIAVEPYHGGFIMVFHDHVLETMTEGPRIFATEEDARQAVDELWELHDKLREEKQ